MKLFSERADLLIHEATYLNPGDRGGESYHSTVEEACDTARRAKVKLLALFHRAFRYSYEDYVKEALKICESLGVSAVVPKDFDVITFKSGTWELRNLLEERG